jgi:hypothetical protein
VLLRLISACGRGVAVAPAVLVGDISNGFDLCDSHAWMQASTRRRAACGASNSYANSRDLTPAFGAPRHTSPPPAPLPSGADS